MNGIFIYIGLIVFSLFFIDLIFPLGIANGLLYLIPMVLTLRNNRENVTLWLAGITSIFVIVGWIYSPQTDMENTVIINRIISIVAIWLLAIIIRKFIKTRRYWDRIGKYEIFDKMMEGVQIISPQYKYIYLNNALLDQVDMQRENVLGKSMMEKFSGFENNDVFDQIENCMTKRMPVQMFNEFKFPDGRVEIFELKMQPIPEGLLILSIIVTEQKQQEIELQKLSLATEQSPVSVVVTDTKGNIEYVNESFCRLSGYSEFEVLGKKPSILKSGYTSDEVYNDLWKTITLGKIWEGELCNKKKDGTIFWEYAKISPIFDGEIVNYIGVKEDITERKMAEEALAKMNQELEERVKKRTEELALALKKANEMNELKSRFVSTASHEFRTPLTGILSATSLIDRYRGLNQPEKQEKHIRIIRAAVSNLTEILNGYLSLDKLEQDKINPKREKIELSQFIHETLQEIHGHLKKGQKINLDLTGEKYVVIDKQILKNVLFNLLSNGIKYSEENVDLIIDSTKDNLSIQVTDRGIGIPEEEQHNLFSSFYRANNVMNIQGTGLGLNIVKRYVEFLGGSIEFTSKLDEGTTFNVRIPVSKN